MSQPFSAAAKPFNSSRSELDAIQMEVNDWHQRQSAQLKASHARLCSQLRQLEELILAGGMPMGHHQGSYTQSAPARLDWEQLTTPSRNTKGNPDPEFTPSMASPPVSHPLSFETLLEEVERDKVRKSQAAGAIPKSEGQSRPVHENSPSKGNTRPTPDSLPSELTGGRSPMNRNTPCQVLVEFKRRRVLQFESPRYVAPGEYVVVGGDRGEDIGLVTHTWAAGSQSTAPEHIAKWAGVGLGKVLRVATVLEVSQLQGVQTELEARAVEVAQEKVQEHGLPMRIVDAEYQFDRKKLTFYYQSQQRLDFRNLVRDLYKTFRARIWMEQD
jgi:hypothetical protein